MPGDDFETYFHQRARRFSAFYASEPVARALGRGPMFDRLRLATEITRSLAPSRVLDVGCGSGPLFAQLAPRGVHITGIDPAEAMVRLARQEAEQYPGMVEVAQLKWEDLTANDEFDVAVALGVFDYVGEPARLLEKMGAAADHIIGSFPSPGLRLELRKVRYGARGVTVHGYTQVDFLHLANEVGLDVADRFPLGDAGYVVHFRRR
jgi:SAM-dependent methyltransferase